MADRFSEEIGHVQLPAAWGHRLPEYRLRARHTILRCLQIRIQFLDDGPATVRATASRDDKTAAPHRCLQSAPDRAPGFESRRPSSPAPAILRHHNGGSLRTASTPFPATGRTDGTCRRNQAETKLTTGSAQDPSYIDEDRCDVPPAFTDVVGDGRGLDDEVTIPRSVRDPASRRSSRPTSGQYRAAV